MRFKTSMKWAHLAVEHPLGKGEVVSSILTGSTKKCPFYGYYCRCPRECPFRFNTERSANRAGRPVENPWKNLILFRCKKKRRQPARAGGASFCAARKTP